MGAEPTPRKRTRSALKSLEINDGSPEKNIVEASGKPVRKASRRTSAVEKMAATAARLLGEQNMTEETTLTDKFREGELLPRGTPN